jgi:hypothetical protein
MLESNTNAERGGSLLTIYITSCDDQAISRLLQQSRNIVMLHQLKTSLYRSSCNKSYYASYTEVVGEFETRLANYLGSTLQVIGLH